MSEAKFTTKFQKWACKNIGGPAVFEVKITTGNTFLYSEVRKHQRSWLLAAMGGRNVSWKIPDVGSAYKPFDFFMLSFMDAYIVIRYPKGFVVIGADTFFEEEEKSDRKSLTYERAKEIAAHSGHLS